MKLAKVIGTLVATQKVDSISNMKILMIQPLNEKLEPAGNHVAAIDTVQAGYNDLVYYTLSREASLALPEPFSPVDAAITGIVDQVNVDDNGIRNFKDIFSKE
jgi:ethanolamine utilization protein EutN